jgi:hypothetical protein
MHAACGTDGRTDGRNVGSKMAGSKVGANIEYWREEEYLPTCTVRMTNDR